MSTDRAALTGFERALDDGIVSKELRARALWLAVRKLSGERLDAARGFVRGRRRTTRDVEAFITRIEALPDVERDAPASAVISDAKVVRMRAEYAAGATTYPQLAEKYGLSQRQVARICTGKSRVAAGDAYSTTTEEL